ncbi:aminotransferase [Methanoculleus taiwanensis]|uniref:Aminotransferase n=1 Tax=Methanoculleus taiwanensis TaxID=1550565 RepID=A0A498H141_9EURY|nr:aminotransferase class I/II-fold pyridoxal phosphate-dependent enzyme [Methanoculleus taiwanensis]RXE56077.1 aminotransferase [Methanoculleus taiwanensis]
MKLRDFKLERFLAEYEFRAPYILCASDCETVSVAELLEGEEGGREALMNLRLGYAEPMGSPGLREEIAGLYTTISPEEIIAFNGASEGILAYMNVALSAGDHVVVQSPAYQSLYEVARSVGCDVTMWRMEERDGAWTLDLDLLQEQIRSTTKAVIINSPHNPTGYQIPESDFRAIAEIAADHGAIVFSDEVYRYLEHPGTDRLPAMADIAETGISLGVISKAFGLAGLRTGWIATHDRELLRKLSAFKDYSTICNNVPGEFFTALALRQKDALVTRNLGFVESNLSLLERFFRENGDLFVWSHPSAGSTAFPALLSGASAFEFCTDLVDRQGVLLLPGTVFEYDDRHFRIGYGRVDMPESLRQLERYVEAHLRA